MPKVRKTDLIRRLITAPERLQAAEAKQRRLSTEPEKAHSMKNIATTARKLKITVVLESAPFVQMGVPPDNAPPRTTVSVNVGGRAVTADIATKSIRKAVKQLLEHGAQNVTLILQGALAANDSVEEAGVVAQVKAQPAAGGEAA
jgi:hypothetical protein